MPPVLPPAAKLPTTALSRIAASPVWHEKPSTSRPDASITRAAVAAIFNSVGSSVMRVVTETIFDGSPIEPTGTTKSTKS